MKKPSLVALFAHPDDEAFGPAGTLAIYAETYDVYIICATRGDAGKSKALKDKHKLGDVRYEELLRSAKLLGARDVIMLDYEDGGLCNNIYHSIAADIQSHLDRIQPEVMITYEQGGVSGHLDHVAMSLITHFAFHKTASAKRLLCYTILREHTDLMRGYFVYVPHGKSRDEIDLIVDISDVWELKKQAILQHISQHTDASRMLAFMENAPKEEYFLVEEK